ncbi:hypothetical protein QN277_016024 [Acacia crassicarpa]|uniref:LRAT domain-containing protein n=1 Tax=Acacia crassicarpa TaxID=499986 RepID=A0AAE1JX36_9FABA|nr:hypothetical protein QN277_016024 [Acacia crassicarpa]
MRGIMGVFSNRIDREELKPGDHIYSWRKAYIYAHHGIYVGEGMVIHFTTGGQEIGTGTVLDRLLSSSSLTRPANSPCTQCGDQSNLNGVNYSCLDCFLFGGHLYRFEYGVSTAVFFAQARGGTCTRAPSDPPEDVLHRARYLLENGFGVYNVFKNNCEDFASYCKTELLVIPNISVGRSGQAASYEAAFNAVVSLPLRFLPTSFSGLALVACGRYCINRLASDIGVRCDVAKVPVESLIRLIINPSILDDPANTNEVNRLIEPPGSANTNEVNRLIEPPASANTNEVNRLIEPPGSANTNGVNRFIEPPGSANTNGVNRFIEPSGSANTNEVNRLIEPPGLDEQAQANKKAKEE